MLIGFLCLDKSVVPGQRLGSKNSHSSFFQKNGYVTVSDIKASLKWETERARHVLEHLLKEGLAWLDLQAPGEAHYWLPALFTDLYSQEITAEEAREALP